MGVPKVSVIVPFYNVKKYLDICLNSIENQSFRDFEVIMVNDGSFDGSEQIALSYSERLSNFTLINQENLGLGGARNTGIKHSSGEFVVFPDSDDWVHKDYLKILYETAITEGADVVECRCIRVWEDGKQKNHLYNKPVDYIITDFNREDYLKNVSYVVWNKIFRRGLFKDTWFPEHMSKQDYAWTPIILARASKIVIVDDVLYYYLWRSDSATNATKVNFNLLKAQHILESSELKDSYPRVLRFYFIRNIMGTLLWAMSQDKRYTSDIVTILTDAYNKYGDLSDDICSTIIGNYKTIWARMLLKKRYLLARVYARAMESARSIVRILN